LVPKHVLSLLNPSSQQPWQGRWVRINTSAGEFYKYGESNAHAAEKGQRGLLHFKLVLASCVLLNSYLPFYFQVFFFMSWLIHWALFELLSSSVSIEKFGLYVADSVCSLLIFMSVLPLLKNSALVILLRIPVKVQDQLPAALS
jgi:hypothetical protein